MKLLQRAGKNIFWLFLSEICARGLTFVAALYLARLMGTSGFGLYSLAIALGFYLRGITDAGVGGYGLRSVAKNRERAADFLSSLNSMRIFISFLILLLVSIILFLSDMPIEKKFILLAGSVYAFAFSISPDWVFQGLEEMKYLVAGKLAASLTFLTSIFLFIKTPSDVLIAVLFFSVSHIIGGIVLLSILYRKFKIAFSPRFSVSEWWGHFKNSFFFFLADNITNLGKFIPILLIALFSSSEQLGIFSAPYKLTVMIFAVGNIVTLGIYPMLSNLYLNDIRAFHHLHNSYQDLVVLVGIPLATAGTLLSNEIILLLFGEKFGESGDIMKILIWLVPLSLLRLNYSRTLLSANFHRLNSIALGSGAFVTTILCILLIPQYESLGASLALIGGEIVTLLMLKWIASAKLNTSKLISSYFLKVVIASVILGIILLNLNFHVLINTALGIIFFVIMIFIMGIINKEKIKNILMR